MSDKEFFLIEYLKKEKITTSWDWIADVAYAKLFYPELFKIGVELLNSRAIHKNLIAVYVEYFSKVKRNRLKNLNLLKKRGLVESSWVGTGFGGKDLCGRNRVKAYKLKSLEME